MNNDTIDRRLEEIDAKLTRVAHDVKRLKQFFFWSIIATVVTFVLPLIIAIIAIPVMMSKYLHAFDGYYESIL